MDPGGPALGGIPPSDAAHGPDPIARLSYPELRVGSEVGRGGFSVVSLVERVDLGEAEAGSETEAEVLARHDLSNTVLTRTGMSRYVVKTLRNDLPETEYTKGIVDLAVEARFLSQLSHPNIISMRGMASSDPLEARFFVVLERLTVTLDYRLLEWRRECGAALGSLWLGPCLGHCLADRPALNRIWIDRLLTARDVAAAVGYLHRNSVLYRDLKPDNVGYDGRGRPKIFDFGLAKRLHPDDHVGGGLYSLTGNTGSLRYMAPEVALGLPYSHRADAYSFGIVLWQICALATPYAGYTPAMHSDLVIDRGLRPRPSDGWPVPWTDLMRRCWSARIGSRPEFDEVVATLDQEIDDLLLEGGGEEGRRRQLAAIEAARVGDGGDGGDGGGLDLDLDLDLGGEEAAPLRGRGWDDGKEGEARPSPRSAAGIDIHIV